MSGDVLPLDAKALTWFCCLHFSDGETACGACFWDAGVVAKKAVRVFPDLLPEPASFPALSLALQILLIVLGLSRWSAWKTLGDKILTAFAGTL